MAIYVSLQNGQLNKCKTTTNKNIYIQVNMFKTLNFFFKTSIMICAENVELNIVAHFHWTGFSIVLKVYDEFKFLWFCTDLIWWDLPNLYFDSDLRNLNFKSYVNLKFKYFIIFKFEGIRKFKFKKIFKFLDFLNFRF